MSDYDISGMTDEEKEMPKYTYGHRIPYEWVDDVITTLHQYQKSFEDIRAELEKAHIEAYRNAPNEEGYYGQGYYDGIGRALNILDDFDPSKAEPVGNADKLGKEQNDTN